jgi:thiol-disulfide isomerase/thioredoxin
MVKRILGALVATTLISGCSLSVPEGYRPTPSDLPTIGVTQIPVAERTDVISFSGKTIHEKDLNLDDISGPIVLNAWASWCTQCRDEWPVFVAAQEKYPDVSFVGMNEADDLEAALEFAAKYGDLWPHFSDPEQTLAINNEILTGPYLPMTVILDSQHRVAARIVGTATEPELTALLDSVLAE